MKDAFGAELELGDRVVFADRVGRSMNKLYKGTITRVSEKNVMIVREDQLEPYLHKAPWRIYKVGS